MFWKWSIQTAVLHFKIGCTTVMQRGCSSLFQAMIPFKHKVPDWSSLIFILFSNSRSCLSITSCLFFASSNICPCFGWNGHTLYINMYLIKIYVYLYIRKKICTFFLPLKMRRQRGFMKEQSFLTNLIAFFYEVATSEDEKRSIGVSSLDFSIYFETIFHNILIGKLMNYKLSIERGWKLTE